MKKEVLRRLDSLGRIVLPKDMRQRLFMSDGDPFEVSFENNSIVLRPFIPLTELEGFFRLCIKVAKQNDLLIVITSRTEVLYSFTNEIVKGTPLQKSISGLITSRQMQDIHDSKAPVIPNSCYLMQAIYPIVSYGELYGAMIVVDTFASPLTEEQNHKLTFLRDFIAEEVSMR